MNRDLNNLTYLRGLSTKSMSATSMFHMHASRSGPLLANEIYLSKKEKEQNPHLRLIRGLQQPYGTVAKFLGYWLSGLDVSIANDILSRIYLDDGTPIYKNGIFKKNILNISAGEVIGEWTVFVDALVSPLFLVDNGSLVYYGFNNEDLKRLKKTREGEKVSFEEAATDISLSIVNAILEKHKLPMYEIVRFDAQEITGIHFKYLQRDIMEREYDYLSKKKQKRYESCYDTILKLLKSYNGVFPEQQKLTKIIERSYRINPSFRNLCIDLEEIRFRFNNLDVKRNTVLNYEEQLAVANSAYMRSIRSVKGGHPADLYVDGENMVKAMFVLADARNECLVLQEFIRGTDYDLYKQLVEYYSELEFKLSACRIWDTQEFPEFDKNFITALKYLDSA